MEMAFGPRDLSSLLPAMSDIPNEFKQWTNPWVRLAARWFYSGLNGNFVAKEGIDGRAALRHVGAILRSFEPQHEHKEAGCAYLLSLWFERYEDEAPA